MKLGAPCTVCSADRMKGMSVDDIVEEELDIGNAGLVISDATVSVFQACDFCEGTGRAFCDSEPCKLCRCCAHCDGAGVKHSENCVVCGYVHE